MMRIDASGQLNKSLQELVEAACRGEPVMISTGEHRAVLMSEDEYRSQIETLHLLQDPEMASDLKGHAELLRI